MSESTAGNNAVRYELVAEAVHDPGSTDPIVLLRKTLRGRYALASALAVGLGALGALIGYGAVPPVYESTGLVRVAPIMPAVLYEETSAQFSEPFEAFAEAQTTQLSSRPVLREAASSPALQELGWPGGDEGVQQLEDALSVARERGQQFVRVAVQHNEPTVAQTAVNAVLEAYRQQYSEHQALSPEEAQHLLGERQAKLEVELKSLREKMLESSGQYGVDVINDMHERKVEQLMAIDQKLAQITRAVEVLSGSLGTDNKAAQNRAVRDALSQLASQNTELSQSLLQQQQTLQAELESWKRRYGAGHPMIRELSRKLEVVELRLQMESGPGLLAAAADGDDQSNVQSTLDQLLDLEHAYLEMRDSIGAEAEELGRRRAAIAGIEEHIATVKQRLAQTRQRLDALQVESSRPETDRVQLASMGDLPLAPLKDRRKGLAAAAGMFGAVCGVGIAFLFGMLDKRCRYLDQLAQCAGNLPIVARLPDVTSAGEQDLSRSALAVHSLRQSLQVRCRSTARGQSEGDAHKSKVIAVTSAGAGEGKTSLTLALATSFAGAGTKTLIIDAQPRNGALSAELGMDRLPGLYDAIVSGGETGEIRRTGSEHLWVLPVGHTANAVNGLSHEHLTWITDAVADRFDVILIDTGAVCSSVEAHAACAAADYVLLVTMRYQDMDAIREAVHCVQRTCAGEAGIVYNRAQAEDVRDRVAPRTAAASGIAPLVPGLVPAQPATVGRIDQPNIRVSQQQDQAA